jgi:hypothetical protein
VRLFKFTDEEEHEYSKQGRRRTRVGRRCQRCGNPIPTSEGATYDESGLCGWCDHMYQKLVRE